MAYSLVTATHLSKRGRVWLCFALLIPWQSNSNFYHVRYTWATWSPCFIPLFDLLALFDPPDLHVGASKICLPSGRPVCVCVHCYWHAETSFQFKMRNRIPVNVSRYDKRFDITCHCDLIRCISQQGARGRIDGTGQRRPIYVVVKTYLHFRHGMWLTREPPSRFYFCFNLLNSISTSICWISCLLSIGEIVISRFIFSKLFISIFLLTSLDLSPTLGFVSYSRMMDPGTRPGVPKNILIDVLPSQKSAVWIGHVSYLRPWLYHP